MTPLRTKACRALVACLATSQGVMPVARAAANTELPSGHLAIVGALSPGVPSATKSSTTYKVTYTPGTVVLDPSTVRSILKGASADGTTYTFKGSPPALKGVHPGTILLIGGKALRTVRSVAHAGGDTTITTSSANLLQAIKNGHIGWDQHIDFASSSASPMTISVGDGLKRVMVPSAGDERVARVAGPRSTSAASTSLCPLAGPEEPFARSMISEGKGAQVACRGTSSDYQLASGPGTIVYKGTISGYDVDLNFDESSLAGLLVNLTAKKTDGSTLLTAKGNLHALNDAADILVENSHLNNFNYEPGALSGELKVGWHAFTSSAGAQSLMDNAAFSIPVAVTVPFLVGPIPVTVAVKASLSVEPAIEDNRGSSGGSITVEYNTDEDVVGSGSGATVSGSLGAARFSISGQTVTAGYVPTGLGMDVEFPRIEMSILGAITTFVSLDAHAYGYFTPGTTFTNQIKACQKAGASLAGYAGVTLGLFGLPAVTISKKTLFQSKPWVVYGGNGSKCD